MAFMLGSFLGGVSDSMQKNTELQAQYGYRNAELSLQARKIALEEGMFTRSTQKDVAERWAKDFDTLLAVGAKGQENGSFTTPGAREAYIDRLNTAAVRAAAPLANITLGGPGTPGTTHEEHYAEMMNRAYGTLIATADPQHIGIADGLRETYKQKTGNDLKLPQAQGAAALGKAQSGGAAAAGLTRAAEEEVTPKAITPEQRLVAPPPGSLTGTSGAGVASPTQAVVTPQMAPPPSTGQIGQPAPVGQSAPAMGGPAPAAGPRTLVPATMQPGTYQAETEIGKQFGEKGTVTYDKAQQTLLSLYQMNMAADKLQQTGGFLSPGAGANFRVDLAKGVNGIATVFGGQQPFDPNAVGEWESLNKNTKLMGMQVVNTMFGGSREAASIVNGATSAVPNAENTYLGYRLVSSGIEQATGREMELHQFLAQKLAGNQMVSNAAAEFNKTHPAALYVMRAIANAAPDEYVNALKANPNSVASFDSRFGKGVGEFILQGGRTGMGSVGGGMQ